MLPSTLWALHAMQAYIRSETIQEHISSSKSEGKDALPPEVEGSSAPTAGGVLAEVWSVAPTVSG
jgi:hypothetical protein